MMRYQLGIGLGWCACLLLAASGCSQSSGNPQEAAAVSAIRQLSGKVEFDEKVAERPVIKVYLHGTAVKDGDLAVLEKLPKLQNLFLGRTKITDAGMEHLKGKVLLQTLSLNSTEITDAGLKQLTGLTALKTLNLQETRVTATGIDELRRSIPGLTMAH